MAHSDLLMLYQQHNLSDKTSVLILKHIAGGDTFYLQFALEQFFP